MDRRSFLGTVTAATLLTRRLGWAADDHKIDRIGVQLYTVRSEIAKDFEGSLAKVASIGDKEDELAGFKMKDGKVSYFDRYPGRFPFVHVKDLMSVPPITAAGEQNFGDSMKEMTEVGSGVIDWKRIFAHSEKAGIKHYFVEHDNPKAPFDSIRTSYQYLERLRF